MRYIVSKLILSILAILIALRPVPVNAGWVSGDEALGGFSYMMECAYENRLPEGQYWNLYYQAYMMFHWEYTVSNEAREILLRIVEAEATGGNVSQKMNVVSCVLARVESPYWPNDIKSVVFDNNGKTWQFSPISDGRYYTVTITNSTIKAVDKVLKNGKTHNCLWFCSDGSYNKKNKNGEYISYHRNYLEYGFFDEMHHYFY